MALSSFSLRSGYPAEMCASSEAAGTRCRVPVEADTAYFKAESMEVYSRSYGPTSDVETTRNRLSRLAWLLDSSIPIPGLNFRIGLEALIGLIPGIGDAVGVILSSYILREAARIGVPKATLIRMGLNVALEGLVGMIPFAGDVFDAAFKANQRNVRLLNAYLENPRKTSATSNVLVIALAFILIAFMIGTSILGFMVLQWVWQAISG
jgi:hypothetical protein